MPDFSDDVIFRAGRPVYPSYRQRNQKPRSSSTRSTWEILLGQSCNCVQDPSAGSNTSTRRLETALSSISTQDIEFVVNNRACGFVCNGHIRRRCQLTLWIGVVIPFLLKSYPDTTQRQKAHFLLIGHFCQDGDTHFGDWQPLNSGDFVCRVAATLCRPLPSSLPSATAMPTSLGQGPTGSTT